MRTPEELAAVTLPRMTYEQRQALTRLFERNAEGAPTLEAFAAAGGLAHMVCGDGCVLLRWCGMTVGIERDGYTHS